MTRKYTNLLYEMIEDGLLDKDTVITAFCKYLSEADVEDMMHINEMIDHSDKEYEMVQHQEQ
jgi:hypothetical protein|tara:strand:- start:538 stop:723 length:186 start_codon:yes stop_codon:yes gene_type:complete